MHFLKQHKTFRSLDLPQLQCYMNSMASINTTKCETRCSGKGVGWRGGGWTDANKLLRWKWKREKKMGRQTMPKATEVGSSSGQWMLQCPGWGCWHVLWWLSSFSLSTVVLCTRLLYDPNEWYVLFQQHATLLLSAFLMARLCSVMRSFNVLLVSPMYTLPHSHGIVYMAPLVLFGSARVLTFVR